MKIRKTVPTAISALFLCFAMNVANAEDAKSRIDAQISDGKIQWLPAQPLPANALADRFSQPLRWQASPQKSLMSNAATEPAEPQIAPPINGCIEIQTGITYQHVTAAGGQLNCYQFVANEAFKLDGIIANLPANETHDLHLMQVATDGSLSVVDTMQGPGQSKMVQIITTPARYVLAVSAQGNAAGGASYNIFADLISGFDAMEPNDTRPTRVTTNTLLQGNIDNPDDLDLFHVKLPRKVAYVRAKLPADLVLLGASGQELPSDTTQEMTPNNPNGEFILQIRARSGNLAIPQNYSLRISDGNVRILSAYSTNNENLTQGIYGQTNAHKKIFITGELGNDRHKPALEGEEFIIQIFKPDSTGKYKLFVERNLETDVFGKRTTVFHLPAHGCENPQSTVVGGPHGNWTMVYEQWHYNVQVINPADSVPFNERRALRKFIKVCSETYHG